MRKIGIIVGAVVVIGGGLITWRRLHPFAFKEPIKIGILHSMTGKLSHHEQHLVDAELLAIEEINARGGVLGRPIEPIIIDSKSDDLLFASGARDLIEKNNVVALFGGWSSGSRKEMMAIVEQHQNVLFYPVDTEGMEDSPNIIYTGSAPNQALIPAVTWAFYNLGKRFFLVGSEDIYSHVMNVIIRDHAKMLGATVVGEAYVTTDEATIAAAIAEIQKTEPSVIINSIDGAPNGLFFPQLRKAGLSSVKLPTISLSISEQELELYGSASMVGDYGVGNYFQSIDRPENKIFIERFKKRFGTTRVVGVTMESAYNSVYFWAEAVDAALTTDPVQVIKEVKQQVVNGPGSIVYIDENNYTWLRIFIGKILFDGQYIIVWDSKKAMHPEPYPPYRSEEAWNDLVKKLYTEWGNKWEK